METYERRLEMHVALDATPLTLSTGGLRRYTSELSLALAREFPEDEYVLMSDQRFSLQPDRPRNLSHGAGPRNSLERRWWLWGANREMSRYGTELFHGTDFAVPYLAQRPSVLTLHDLSPWMVREWHAGAGRVRRRVPLLIGLHVPTVILTVSQAVRRQAIDHFGIHPARIIAVPNAAARLFRPVPEPNRGRRPYFLFVGTLEPRKNIAGLIDAWRHVQVHHAVDLVLAGRRREDFPTLPACQGLNWLGELPDEELPALYSGALAVVYPSCYEGFGLPVLEAMSCGACVIISGDEALRELAAGAALQARDGKELVAAMLAALTRPSLVCQLRALALERAKLYSWERTARLTREVYGAALQRGL